MSDVRGIDVSRGFYLDVVAPLLDGIPHAAGRLGHGSDVLGLDDEMSQDHDWGCRLTVLVDADVVDDLDGRFERELPETYAGMPVRFPTSWKPSGHQVWISTAVDPVFLATMPSDGIGSVEMWCDSVDVLAKPWRRVALRTAYEAWRS